MRLLGRGDPFLPVLDLTLAARYTVGSQTGNRLCGPI